MTEKKDMDYMRAKVFFKQKIPIHISINNGIYYNGYILEEPKIDFFFIHDRVTGRQLIFYEELNKPITAFEINKEEKNENKRL